jgi:parallel beta-helix repeat protein
MGATWTVPGDFSTLQDAIDAPEVVHGDTILVFFMPNTLTSSINKELNIVGVAEDFFTGNITEKPIIDGMGSGSVIIISAIDYVSIKGFQITNSGEDPGDSGIECNSCTYIIIEDNDIYNNLLGIKLDDCSYCGIYLNTISDNEGRAIDFRDCHNNLITLNKVIDNNNGLAIQTSFQNMITWNHIVNNALYGIFTYNIKIPVQSDENIIKHNNIYNNSARNAYTQRAINIWRANYWGSPRAFYFIPLWIPQMDPNPSDTEYFIP